MIAPIASLTSAAVGFSPLDWGVVALVLVVITVAGKRLAGRQSTMRDFFLGGRRLPWPAVSASIVATEISAVTYISLPSVVFKDGGDITYLQLGLIGSFLARAIVAYVLVPAYFEREIYSPYDYMGARLGEGVRRATTVLFSVGGVLGQSARVYLTAVVLEVVLAPELAWWSEHVGWDPLVSSVVAIGVVAVVWTWMGGIAAVVWTDVFLFLLFLVGIAVSLWAVHVGLQPGGGLPTALSDGVAAGKFRFFDFSPDPTRAYTFWAACIAAPWGMVGPYGTDQLITQRLLCCKSARDARWAMLASTASIVITFLVALLGVGLWAFYRAHPLEGELAALVTDQPDKVFPVFITASIPAGLRGLVIAGAFAAAISSLDSILAALSQTTVSTFLSGAGAPGRGGAGSERRTLFASRASVLVWGALLCAAAVSMRFVREHYASVLDLALAMAGYTGGALLAAFFLAFLPARRGAGGFLWSAPLSVLGVFGLVWHGQGPERIATAAALLWLAAWFVMHAAPASRHAGAWSAGLLRQALAAFAGAALVIVLSRYARFDDGSVLAFPWYIPCGSSIAFVFALALEPRALRDESSRSAG